MKSIFTSKTFWANVGVGIVGVFTEALGSAGIDPAWYAAAVAAMNVGLRYITKEPVTVS